MLYERHSVAFYHLHRERHLILATKFEHITPAFSLRISFSLCSKIADKEP